MGDIGNSENLVEGKYHQLIKCLMLLITTCQKVRRPG